MRLVSISQENTWFLSVHVDDELVEFRRYDSEDPNWERRWGESWECEYDTEEIEQIYQDVVCPKT